MSRDDIIRMAREASFTDSSEFAGCFVCNPHSLERFAALVAAAEREACAQLCEDIPAWNMDDPGETGAKYIRSRGEQ